MNAKDRDRLSRLEGQRNMSEAERDDAKRLEELRRSAEHANRCQGKDEEPLFVGLSGGEVFCARDGRPVTDILQITCEKFYWMEVASGGMGLIHDEANQAFFTPGGELALSRDFVHLERLMGEERMKAWESEIA